MARSKQQKVDLPEVNLTPIMSILVILIPILLFAFNFFQLKIQKVQAPRTGKSSKPKDPTKQPLNLTILITKQGFAVQQQKELMGEAAGAKIPKAEDGQYNFAKLYNVLVRKKEQYPKEKIVNIGAEFEIEWQVVARTIDATQYFLEEKSYESNKEYRDAKLAMEEVEDDEGNTKKKPIPLFDQVVFVVAE